MPLYFDVDGLEEGQEYNFRVKAINDEGESDPLEGDKPIKAKNPFGEYTIAISLFRNNLGTYEREIYSDILYAHLRLNAKRNKQAYLQFD